MSKQTLPPIERLSTGNSSLDEILGGGFPAGSVTVVMGEPGSGKTVFTLQMMFHLARQGKKKCLYFTTLSEPALKVIRFMQHFSFFDARLLEDRITLADLGSVIRTEGPEEAIARVKDRVENEEPAFVAIDSFKAMHDIVADPNRSRALVYDLAVSTASWQATTLLVGEYLLSDIGELPEFAIADGILRLGMQPQELTMLRELEVLKLRGTDYVTGRHFFDMGGTGLTFYPRVRGPGENGDAWLSSERVATGVGGLDDLLGGGLPRASVTFVEGGTGTGKTLMGLHFLVEGARKGEPGILFTLEETPEQLRGIAHNFAMNLKTLEKTRRLTLHYTSPVELSTDRFLNVVRQRTEELQARRVVLDSITSVGLSVPSSRRFRELIYAMTKHFHAAGVTSVMTLETAELFGSVQIGGNAISAVGDNLILLRYVELDGQLERAISVVKARGVNHERHLHRLVIGKRGATIGSSLANLRGVLTGIPTPATLSPLPPRERHNKRRP
jgi:circadian clock protein KaiC